MLTVIQYVLWVLIAIPFVLALLVLALAIPALILAPRSHRRAIDFCANSLCPKCGKKIGRDATLAASEAYTKKAHEMFEDAKRRGIKLRTAAPKWEIRCPNCASQFYFYPNTRKIESERPFQQSNVQEAN